MTTLYITSAVVIVLLLCFLVIRSMPNKKQTDNPQSEVEKETLLKVSIESPLVPKQKEIDSTESPAVNKIDEMDLEERPEIGKNKWLYGATNFGTMEHGVVDSQKKGKKKKKRIIFLD